MRGIDLKAVLTCISRTRHDDIAYRLHGIESQFATRQVQDRLHDMFGLRTLQRYLSIIVATVLQINIKAFGILLHPGPVLIDICSIDDQEEIILCHLVDEQVINSTAILVAHHAIIDLTYRCIGYIVRKYMLHVTFGIRSLDGHFSHMRHIKESGMFANSHMLWCDTSILIKEWHVKATERYHCSPQRHMSFIQARTFVSSDWFCFNSHSK